MKTIFDIGMYDGSDTQYYLSEGYNVVAVEANPNLIEKAKKLFQDELSTGQLILVNAAICDKPGQDITLTLCGDDLGSSSIIENKISGKNPVGSYSVKGMTIGELVDKYGVPYFIKIDIEGADRYIILSLKAANKPQYISFEAGEDLEELVSYLQEIGYTRFKAINQLNFCEIHNQESLSFRIKRKIIDLLGYREPRYVRKNNRFFLLGHSAGPAPWVSDGKWYDSSELLKKWNLATSKNELGGWYDIHAT